MTHPVPPSSGSSGHLGHHGDVHRLLNSLEGMSVDDLLTVKALSPPDVKATDKSALRSFVHILDYGAALDGTTDDRQALLDALADLPNGRGTVMISGGTALIDGTVDVDSSQQVYIAADAAVHVPSAYTGTLFRFVGSRGSVDGAGRISEVGPRSSDWTAFHFDGAAGGVHHNRVGPVEVWHAGRVFHFEQPDLGAVNGNIMDRTQVHKPVVIWEHTQTDPTQSGLLSRNIAFGVNVQAEQGTTTHVLKNIVGFGNQFIGCLVFDANEAVTEITEHAVDTLILGGRGMGFFGKEVGNYTDDGQHTVIIDPDNDTLATGFHLVSGMWYGPVPDATAAGSEGWAFATPIWLPRQTTLDRVACEVTVAGETGSKVRMGLYDTDPDGEVGDLIVDAGTVAGDTIGVKELTIDETVSGLVWSVLALQQCPSTAPTVRSISSGDVGQPDWMGSAGAFDNWRRSRFATGVTGALPDPGTFTTSGGNTSRVVRVRVA